MSKEGKYVQNQQSARLIGADIPIPVVTLTGIMDGLLTFELDLGESLPSEQMDRERLKLALAVNGQNYSSQGKTGWFEGEMRTCNPSCRPARS